MCSLFIRVRSTVFNFCFQKQKFFRVFTMRRVNYWRSARFVHALLLYVDLLAYCACSPETIFRIIGSISVVHSPHLDDSRGPGACETIVRVCRPYTDVVPADIQVQYDRPSFTRTEKISVGNLSYLNRTYESSVFSTSNWTIRKVLKIIFKFSEIRRIRSVRAARERSFDWVTKSWYV